MENIPIATNIESQQPETSNQHLHAIYVQPYRTTFQPIYIIDIDTQNTIEQQPIEQHQPQPQQQQESNQQVMRRLSIYKSVCIKLIGPIILAIIVIIGIYYNFTIH